MRLQLLAVAGEKARPVESGRHDGWAVPRRLGPLVRHLQEQQERDLLRVGHVGQAVVAEQVREAPRFVDDLPGVVRHQGTRLFVGFAFSLAETALPPVPFRHPFGPDPVQEDRSGLVGGILRDQAALEGALQDGLAEGSTLSSFGLDSIVQSVRGSLQMVDGGHYSTLLGARGYRYEVAVRSAAARSSV